MLFRVEAKSALYRRMWELLGGVIRRKGAIVEILRDTKKDFPASSDAMFVTAPR